MFQKIVRNKSQASKQERRCSTQTAKLKYLHHSFILSVHGLRIAPREALHQVVKHRPRFMWMGTRADEATSTSVLTFPQQTPHEYVLLHVLIKSLFPEYSLSPRATCLANPACKQSGHGCRGRLRYRTAGHKQADGPGINT
jgi:hypothetical protein